MTMEMEKITVQAVVETPRFDLRPLRRSDMGLIELYWSDARVAHMTTSIPQARRSKRRLSQVMVSQAKT